MNDVPELKTYLILLENGTQLIADTAANEDGDVVLFHPARVMVDVERHMLMDWLITDDKFVTIAVDRIVTFCNPTKELYTAWLKYYKNVNQKERNAVLTTALH